MSRQTRQTTLLVGCNGFSAAFSLVLTVIIGKTLGAEGYADFAAATAVTMFANIAFGPINGTVAKFAAEYLSHQRPGKVRKLQDEVTRRLLRYGVPAGVVIAAGLLPFARLLKFRSPLPLALAFAMIYLILLLSVSRGILRGAQAFGAYSVNVLAEGVARLGFGALLVLSLRTAGGALAGYVLAYLSVAVLAWWQTRPVIGSSKPEPIDADAIRRFTGPMFVLMLTTAGFLHMDMLFVKSLFSEGQAGAYGAAVTLSNAVGVLVTPFNIVLLPILTALYEQRRPGRGAFLRVIAGAVIAGVVPLAVFSIWAADLLGGLYGPGFALAAPYLARMAAARLCAYLAAIVALVPVAASRFGFLWVYSAALGVQAAAMLVFRANPGQIVSVALIVQAATLLALSAYIAFTRTSGRRKVEAAAVVSPP